MAAAGDEFIRSGVRKPLTFRRQIRVWLMALHKTKGPPSRALNAVFVDVVAPSPAK